MQNAYYYKMLIFEQVINDMACMGETVNTFSDITPAASNQRIIREQSKGFA